jgi:3-dehydroquinate dehydratase-1
MTNSKTRRIVGVIFSRPDFQRALRMRTPPGLFEVRLDSLALHLDSIQDEIRELPAPLIITARHPREGGANDLSSHERQRLLLAFLPHAAYVDIELRSAGPLAAVLDAARAQKVGIIGSFHDFTSTPGPRQLDRIGAEAHSLGADILKVATKVDTLPQLERLIAFFERQRRSTTIAAMGIGRLGRTSRLEFARRGCPLNYAHLGGSRVAGQLSIGELQRALS